MAGCHCANENVICLQICAILDQSPVDQYWEPDSRVPYLVSGNQWIGYEDVRSFTEKVILFSFAFSCLVFRGLLVIIFQSI